MIDTHSHIYSEEFDTDRDEVIQRAKDTGVKHIILPNIDSESLVRMLALESDYPGYCHAAIGLHPTSVKENYLTEIDLVKSELERRKWIAIGEIGIDLYWDNSFYKEQLIVFQQQLEWSLIYNLPVIIHVRNSFRETMDALSPFKNKGLKGVFHSFTGSLSEAKEIINFEGFKIGINGIVTFKNSDLSEIIPKIGLENILLETDSPYLTPVPFRGKRNESASLRFICDKIANSFTITALEVANKTTKNAINLFF